MNENSEALLTQILLLVQELHNDMTAHKERLSACETITSELQGRLQNVINNAFPNGDLETHKLWHERRGMGAVRRFLLKLLS